jgi:hypothetical protein
MQKAVIGLAIWQGRSSRGRIPLSYKQIVRAGIMHSEEGGLGPMPAPWISPRHALRRSAARPPPPDTPFSRLAARFGDGSANARTGDGLARA